MVTKEKHPVAVKVTIFKLARITRKITMYYTIELMIFIDLMIFLKKCDIFYFEIFRDCLLGVRK